MKKLLEMFSPRDAMEVVLLAAIACGVLGWYCRLLRWHSP
jgi:hypothetical protein